MAFQVHPAPASEATVRRRPCRCIRASRPASCPQIRSSQGYFLVGSYRGHSEVTRVTQGQLCDSYQQKRSLPARTAHPLQRQIQSMAIWHHYKEEHGKRGQWCISRATNVPADQSVEQCDCHRHLGGRGCSGGGWAWRTSALAISPDQYWLWALHPLLSTIWSLSA